MKIYVINLYTYVKQFIRISYHVYYEEDALALLIGQSNFSRISHISRLNLGKLL